MLFGFSWSAFGQVIDTTSLNALEKLQSGDIPILEGEVYVEFTDTVTPGFIRAQFDALEIEISLLQVSPFSFFRYGSLSVEQEQEIQAFSFIDSLVQGTKPEGNFTIPITTAYLGHRFTQSQADSLYALMEPYRFEEPVYFPKGANVRCVPGKEEDMMTQLERLPFVKSTALIVFIE